MIIIATHLVQTREGFNWQVQKAQILSDNASSLERVYMLESYKGQFSQITEEEFNQCSDNLLETIKNFGMIQAPNGLFVKGIFLKELLAGKLFFSQDRLALVDDDNKIINFIDILDRIEMLSD